MSLPLFTWLRSRHPNKDGSKIFALLDHPFGNSYQPKDVTRQVMHRILRDRPMHVVDACELQNRLHGRYNSRLDVFSRNHMYGMVKADTTEKRFHKFIFNYATYDEKKHNAVSEREIAIDKLGKKKKKELEANKELRTLFYLTNELKGLLK